MLRAAAAYVRGEKAEDPASPAHAPGIDASATTPAGKAPPVVLTLDETDGRGTNAFQQQRRTRPPSPLHQVARELDAAGSTQQPQLEGGLGVHAGVFEFPPRRSSSTAGSAIVIRDQDAARTAQISVVPASTGPVANEAGNSSSVSTGEAVGRRWQLRKVARVTAVGGGRAAGSTGGAPGGPTSDTLSEAGSVQAPDRLGAADDPAYEQTPIRSSGFSRRPRAGSGPGRPGGTGSVHGTQQSVTGGGAGLAANFGATSAPSGPLFTLKLVELLIHGPEFSSEDVVLNPDAFPGWGSGDFIVIRPATSAVPPSVSGSAAVPAAAAPPASASSPAVTSATMAAAADAGAGADTPAKLSAFDDATAPESAIRPRLPGAGHARAVTAVGSSVSGSVAPEQTPGHRGLAAATGGHLAASSSAAGPSLQQLPSSVIFADPSTRKGALLLRIPQSHGPVKGNLQLSIRADVAASAGLTARKLVEVRRLEGKDEAESTFGLAHVELSFRDQYASRAGMWRFRRGLDGACLHVGQAASAAGLRMHVREIGARAVDTMPQAAEAGDGVTGTTKPGAASSSSSAQPPAASSTSTGPVLQCISGFVTSKTRFTFRSRSSRMVLLIQMSREMWNFDNDGTTRFEKLVNRFLATLFAKWATAACSHSLSIIVFSRTQYDYGLEHLAALAGMHTNTSNAAAATLLDGADSAGASPFSASSLADRAFFIGADGKLYEDFYIPVVEDYVVGGSGYYPLLSSPAGNAAPSIPVSHSASGGGGTPVPGAAGAAAGSSESTASNRGGGNAPAASEFAAATSASQPTGTSAGAGAGSGSGSGGTSTSSASSAVPHAAEWQRIIRLLKRAFNSFPTRANWGSAHSDRRRCGSAQASAVDSVLDTDVPASATASKGDYLHGFARAGATGAAGATGEGTPTLSSRGNFLEAINLALNIFERHHIDRDIGRMGQNIVVLTAGDGAFEVDPALAQMTKQRMMDGGEGCDIVCMARPPLHNVPLFITRTPIAHAASINNSGGANGSVVSFSMPHWVHVSFFGHVAHQYPSPFAVAGGNGYGSGDGNVDKTSNGSKQSGTGGDTRMVVAGAQGTGSVYHPLSSATLFSLYLPRLSPLGPTYPSALLEALRRSGRASNRLTALYSQQGSGRGDGPRDRLRKAQSFSSHGSTGTPRKTLDQYAHTLKGLPQRKDGLKTGGLPGADSSHSLIQLLDSSQSGGAADELEGQFNRHLDYNSAAAVAAVDAAADTSRHHPVHDGDAAADTAAADDMLILATSPIHAVAIARVPTEVLRPSSGSSGANLLRGSDAHSRSTATSTPIAGGGPVAPSSPVTRSHHVRRSRSTPNASPSLRASGSSGADLNIQGVSGSQYNLRRVAGHSQQQLPRPSSSVLAPLVAGILPPFSSTTRVAQVEAKREFDTERRHRHGESQPASSSAPGSPSLVSPGGGGDTSTMQSGLRISTPLRRASSAGSLIGSETPNQQPAGNTQTASGSPALRAIRNAIAADFALDELPSTAAAASTAASPAALPADAATGSLTATGASLYDVKAAPGTAPRSRPLVRTGAGNGKGLWGLSCSNISLVSLGGSSTGGCTAVHDESALAGEGNADAAGDFDPRLGDARARALRRPQSSFAVLGRAGTGGMPGEPSYAAPDSALPLPVHGPARVVALTGHDGFGYVVMENALPGVSASLLSAPTASRSPVEMASLYASSSRRVQSSSAYRPLGGSPLQHQQQQRSVPRPGDVYPWNKLLKRLSQRVDELHTVGAEQDPMSIPRIPGLTPSSSMPSISQLQQQQGSGSGGGKAVDEDERIRRCYELYKQHDAGVFARRRPTAVVGVPASSSLSGLSSLLSPQVNASQSSLAATQPCSPPSAPLGIRRTPSRAKLAAGGISASMLHESPPAAPSSSLQQGNNTSSQLPVKRTPSSPRLRRLRAAAAGGTSSSATGRQVSPLIRAASSTGLLRNAAGKASAAANAGDSTTDRDSESDRDQQLRVQRNASGVMLAQATPRREERAATGDQPVGLSLSSDDLTSLTTLTLSEASASAAAPGGDARSRLAPSASASAAVIAGPGGVVASSLSSTGSPRLRAAGSSSTRLNRDRVGASSPRMTPAASSSARPSLSPSGAPNAFQSQHASQPEQYQLALQPYAPLPCISLLPSIPVPYGVVSRTYHMPYAQPTTFLFPYSRRYGPYKAAGVIGGGGGRGAPATSASGIRGTASGGDPRMSTAFSPGQGYTLSQNGAGYASALLSSDRLDGMGGYQGTMNTISGLMYSSNIITSSLGGGGGGGSSGGQLFASGSGSPAVHSSSSAMAMLSGRRGGWTSKRSLRPDTFMAPASISGAVTPASMTPTNAGMTAQSGLQAAAVGLTATDSESDATTGGRVLSLHGGTGMSVQGSNSGAGPSQQQRTRMRSPKLEGQDGTPRVSAAAAAVLTPTVQQLKQQQNQLVYAPGVSEALQAIWPPAPSSPMDIIAVLATSPLLRFGGSLSSSNSSSASDNNTLASAVVDAVNQVWAEHLAAATVQRNEQTDASMLVLHRSLEVLAQSALADPLAVAAMAAYAPSALVTAVQLEAARQLQLQQPQQQMQARAAFPGGAGAQSAATGAPIQWQAAAKPATPRTARSSEPRIATATSASQAALFQGQLPREDPLSSAAVSQRSPRSKSAGNSGSVHSADAAASSTDTADLRISARALTRHMSHLSLSGSGRSPRTASSPSATAAASSSDRQLPPQSDRTAAATPDDAQSSPLPLLRVSHLSANTSAAEGGSPTNLSVGATEETSAPVGAPGSSPVQQSSAAAVLPLSPLSGRTRARLTQGQRSSRHRLSGASDLSPTAALQARARHNIARAAADEAADFVPLPAPTPLLPSMPSLPISTAPSLSVSTATGGAPTAASSALSKSGRHLSVVHELADQGSSDSADASGDDREGAGGGGGGQSTSADDADVDRSNAVEGSHGRRRRKSVSFNPTAATAPAGMNHPVAPTAEAALLPLEGASRVFVSLASAPRDTSGTEAAMAAGATAVAPRPLRSPSYFTADEVSDAAIRLTATLPSKPLGSFSTAGSSQPLSSSSLKTTTTAAAAVVPQAVAAPLPPPGALAAALASNGPSTIFSAIRGVSANAAAGLAAAGGNGHSQQQLLQPALGPTASAPSTILGSINRGISSGMPLAASSSASSAAATAPPSSVVEEGSGFLRATFLLPTSSAAADPTAAEFRPPVDAPSPASFSAYAGLATNASSNYSAPGGGSGPLSASGAFATSHALQGSSSYGELAQQLIADGAMAVPMIDVTASLTSLLQHLAVAALGVFPPGAGAGIASASTTQQFQSPLQAAGIASSYSYVLPPAAGALVNPFRRRRHDIQLATANRRRWWHMFPSEQVAEQQFTTPSLLTSTTTALSKAQASIASKRDALKARSSARSTPAFAALSDVDNASRSVDGAVAALHSDGAAATTADEEMTSDDNTTAGYRGATRTIGRGTPASSAAAAARARITALRARGTSMGTVGEAHAHANSGAAAGIGGVHSESEVEQAVVSGSEIGGAGSGATTTGMRQSGGGGRLKGMVSIELTAPEEEEENLESVLQSFVPNWKSLCEPAVMPLTTDFLPSQSELQTHFAETVYSVVLPLQPPTHWPAAVASPRQDELRSPKDIDLMSPSSRNDPAAAAVLRSGTNALTPSERKQALRQLHESVIEEMICARLAQDFQLVVDRDKNDDNDFYIHGPSASRVSPSLTNAGTAPSAAGGAQDGSAEDSGDNTESGGGGGNDGADGEDGAGLFTIDEGGSHHDDGAAGSAVAKTRSKLRKESSEPVATTVGSGDGTQSGNKRTYVLSMGHRIHVIIWDVQEATVDVKMYFRRPGVAVPASALTSGSGSGSGIGAGAGTGSSSSNMMMPRVAVSGGPGGWSSAILMPGSAIGGSGSGYGRSIVMSGAGGSGSGFAGMMPNGSSAGSGGGGSDPMLAMLAASSSSGYLQSAQSGSWGGTPLVQYSTNINGNSSGGSLVAAPSTGMLAGNVGYYNTVGSSSSSIGMTLSSTQLNNLVAMHHQQQQQQRSGSYTPSIASLQTPWMSSVQAQQPAPAFSSSMFASSFARQSTMYPAAAPAYASAASANNQMQAAQPASRTALSALIQGNAAATNSSNSSTAPVPALPGGVPPATNAPQIGRSPALSGTFGFYDVNSATIGRSSAGQDSLLSSSYADQAAYLASIGKQNSSDGGSSGGNLASIGRSATAAAAAGTADATQGTPLNAPPATIAESLPLALISAEVNRTRQDAAAAAVLATLARLLSPGYVDSTGTFRYRYMVWCPYRGEACATGRTFRMPTSAAKALLMASRPGLGQLQSASSGGLHGGAGPGLHSNTLNGVNAAPGSNVLSGMARMTSYPSALQLAQMTTPGLYGHGTMQRQPSALALSAMNSHVSAYERTGSYGTPMMVGLPQPMPLAATLSGVNSSMQGHRGSQGTLSSSRTPQFGPSSVQGQHQQHYPHLHQHRSPRLTAKAHAMHRTSPATSPQLSSSLPSSMLGAAGQAASALNATLQQQPFSLTSSSSAPNTSATPGMHAIRGSQQQQQYQQQQQQVYPHSGFLGSQQATTASTGGVQTGPARDAISSGSGSGISGGGATIGGVGIVGSTAAVQEEYNWSQLDTLLAADPASSSPTAGQPKPSLSSIRAAASAAVSAVSKTSGGGTAASVVTGAAESLPESIRFKRMLFLLMPMPTPTAASLPGSVLTTGILDERLASFERFWAHVQSRMPEHNVTISLPRGGGADGTDHTSNTGCARAQSDLRVFMPQLSDNLPSKPGATDDNQTAASSTSMPRCVSDDSVAVSSVRVDLRARGATHFEWAIVQHGRVFNPARAFPIGIQWVAASSVAIESLVAGLTRRARQCGFVFLQVPEYTRRTPPTPAQPTAVNPSALSGAMPSAASSQNVASASESGIRASSSVNAASLTGSAPSFYAVTPDLQALQSSAAAATNVVGPIQKLSSNSSIGLPWSYGGRQPEAPSSTMPMQKSSSNVSMLAGTAAAPGTAPQRSGPLSFRFDALPSFYLPITLPLRLPAIMPLSRLTAGDTSHLLSSASVSDFGDTPILLLGLTGSSTDAPSAYSNDASVAAAVLRVIFAFEHALVHRFGFMQGLASSGAASGTSAGVGGGSGAGLKSSSSYPGPSSTSSSSQAGAQDPSSSSPSASAASLLLHPSGCGRGWFRQYVHTSGAAFVRLHAGGASWLPNKLHPTKSQSGLSTCLTPWAMAARERCRQRRAQRAAEGHDEDGSCCAWAWAECARDDDGDVDDDVSVGRKHLYRSLAEFCLELMKEH